MGPHAARLVFPLVAFLAVLLPLATPAQSPDLATRLVVGYPPGGGADQLARLIAQELRSSRPVVVENVPGRAGLIAARHVAAGAKDGRTLLLAATGAITLAPLLESDPGYQPNVDLCPVALVAETPHVLLVARDSPVRTVEDLVALARASPGQLSYASLGIRSSAHAVGALFASEARVDMIHVPYNGSSPAVKDLLGGHVTAMFGTVQATLPYIDSGQVRAIAVSSAKRSPRIPEVRTFAEAGLPGLTSTSWYGLFAPCHLPAAAQRKLHRDVRAALAGPTVKEVLRRDGSETLPLFGAGFERFLAGESRRWARAVELLR
jgi:tripartite-type tricarboxylate transporter receptor subunit TctC